MVQQATNKGRFAVGKIGMTPSISGACLLVVVHTILGKARGSRRLHCRTFAGVCSSA